MEGSGCGIFQNTIPGWGSSFSVMQMFPKCGAGPHGALLVIWGVSVVCRRDMFTLK